MNDYKNSDGGGGGSGGGGGGGGDDDDALNILKKYTEKRGNISI
jgi:hypothetical protein